MLVPLRSRLDALTRRASKQPGLISFAGGLPADECLPHASIARAAAEAFAQQSSGALQYGWPEGRLVLRDRIAERLRARGCQVVAEDVIITNGAQDALALVLEVLQPRAVAVDERSYSAALELFRAKGCQLLPNANVRYAMPAMGNPSGRAATDVERRALLSYPWVIEDDAYAELAFDGPPAAPLLAEARHRVFHIGTFSKVLSPGLRLGWLVAPRPFVERLRAIKGRRDLQACGVTQAITERLLGILDYDAHLRMLRRVYQRRCRSVMDGLVSIQGIRWEPPQGGFSIWVESDRIVEDAALLERAIALGVAYDPGALFRAYPSRRLAMRLCFSAVAESRIAKGLQRLGELLDPGAAQPYAASA